MKYYFLGAKEFYDKYLDERILDALNAIIRSDSEPEFIFYRLDAYTKECLNLLHGLKQSFPAARITITRYADPVKFSSPKQDVWYELINGKDMPKYDKTIITPKMSSKTANHPGASLIHFNMTERQIILRCDCLICYTYFELYLQENRMIKEFEKKNGKSIINLASPETALYIQDCYKHLRDRERRVLGHLCNGGSVKDLTIELGVKAARLYQIAGEATIKLQKFLRQNPYNPKKPR